MICSAFLFENRTHEKQNLNKTLTIECYIHDKV